jgi:serine/threonine protein kinase
MTGALRSKYALGEPLGSGSVGTVYRVHSESSDHPLAIKVLNPEFADDGTVLERLSKDKAMLRSLRNAHLVTVEDLVVEPDRLAIVSELVSGGTLHDYLHLQGKLPSADALSITRQVLAGLAVVHARGLAHGRLTPQNVLLSSSATAGPVKVKVSDFGQLRLISGAMASAPYSATSYAAPELADGQLASPSSDLFSVGVMLHELLTGRLPSQAPAKATAATKRRASSAPRRPTQISAPLWRVLLTWLSPLPAERPANTWIALASIENLLEASAPSQPTEQVTLVKQPAERPALQLTKQTAKKAAVAPTLVTVGAAAMASTSGPGSSDVLEVIPDVLEVTTDLPVIEHDLTVIAPPAAPPAAPPFDPPAFDPPAFDSPIPFESPSSFDSPPPFDAPPEGQLTAQEPPQGGNWLRRWSRSRSFDATGIVAVLVLLGGSIYGLTSSSPAKSYSYTFTAENSPSNGVQIRRTWTVTGGNHPSLHADVEFRTSQAAATTVDELIPSSLLSESSSIKFDPEPQHVDGNHVVRYSLSDGSSQLLDATYDVAVPSKDVSLATLQRWAYQQQQQTGDLYRASHELASLSLAKSVTVTVGKTVALKVGAKQQDGTTAPSVALGGAKYTIDNTKIATVASDGRVTGKHAGKTTVHVSIGSLSVSSAVIVSAVKSKATTAPNTDPVVDPTTAPVASSSATTKARTSTKSGSTGGAVTVTKAPTATHTTKAPPATPKPTHSSGPTTPPKTSAPPSTAPSTPSTPPTTSSAPTTPPSDGGDPPVVLPSIVNGPAAP